MLRDTTPSTNPAHQTQQPPKTLTGLTTSLRFLLIDILAPRPSTRLDRSVYKHYVAGRRRVNKTCKHPLLNPLTRPPPASCLD